MSYLSRRPVMLFAVSAILFASGALTALSQRLINDKPPQQIIAQKALSLDAALDIADTALQACRAKGYHVSIEVLDSSGLPKVYLRDDGSSLQTIDASRRKAYTALLFNRPSSVTLEIWSKDPHRDLNPIEGTLAMGGGMPITVSKELVGGIGVSGAYGQGRADEGTGHNEDEVCATAGIKTIDKLK